MIILPKGVGQRLEEYMRWSIIYFKHQADEISPDDYSPELLDAIELEKFIKKELSEDNR